MMGQDFDVTEKAKQDDPKAPPAVAALPPKVKAPPIPPAARPARMHPRHWLILLSFLLTVLVPITGIGVYLYSFAADQYVSKVGFSVRKEEGGSAFDVLGSLASISGSSSTDTDILYEYIQSQELVADAEKALDLSHIYQKPQKDPVFSLKDNASIEDLVDYWLGMVRVFYDPGTGLIEVEVRSFDPQDSHRIASYIFSRSSEMINQLSAVARDDIRKYAKEDLDKAIERLKIARSALTKFRNAKQIVDPTADIQGQMGLVNSLNAQLASALIELDLLQSTTQESDPRVRQAENKIVVIKNRIQEERAKLGVGNTDGSNAFADVVEEFERLQVDQEFAEKTYILSLSSFDKAVGETQRKSRYLAAYVKPTLAQTPLYPQRTILMIVSLLLLFGIWSISVLVYYSLKDRR